MKLSIIVLGLLAALVAGTPLHAQVPDRQNGLVLAQQVCAACHAVLADGTRSPKAGAPTFKELATTPGMNSMALSVAFTTPHAGMPMFQLTSGQAADIIAYILSLRADFRGFDPEGGRSLTPRRGASGAQL
jgi:mono/diheme cytochrome c family protein